MPPRGPVSGVVLLGLLLLGAAAPASAQPVAVPETWGGDFGSESDEPSTGLMHATFMQFLSPKLGLIAGKIFTLDAPGEFAGSFRTQFLNVGLTIPMSLVTVPISAYGGGVVVLPWDGAVLSVASGRLEDVDTTVVAGLRFHVRF